MVFLQNGNASRERSRSMDDIGVREEDQVTSRHHYAMIHRIRFSEPSWVELRILDERYSVIFSRKSANNLTRLVSRMVVDNDYLQVNTSLAEHRP